MGNRRSQHTEFFMNRSALFLISIYEYFSNYTCFDIIKNITIIKSKGLYCLCFYAPYVGMKHKYEAYFDLWSGQQFCAHQLHKQTGGFVVIHGIFLMIRGPVTNIISIIAREDEETKFRNGSLKLERLR